MSLYNWIFGNSEDVQRKRTVSSNKWIRDVLNDFLKYVELFKEKKKATETLDSKWFKGKIYDLMKSIFDIIFIVKSEINSERDEQYLIHYIQKKNQKLEIPDIGKLLELLIKLEKNLEKQHEFLTDFSLHQDMNKLECLPTLHILFLVR